MRRVATGCFTVIVVVLALIVLNRVWAAIPPFVTARDCERLTALLAEPGNDRGRTDFFHQPISGGIITHCLGEPTYYSAYEQQEPHHIAVIVDFWYPEKGVYLHSYQLRGLFGEVDLNARTNFVSIYRYPATIGLEDVQAVLGVPWGRDIDEQGWFAQMLRPWQGWSAVDILMIEEVRALPTPDRPPTMTAIAVETEAQTLALITPFDASIEPESQACRKTLNWAYVTLPYGQIPKMNLVRFLQEGGFDNASGVEPDFRESEDQWVDLIRWTQDNGRYRGVHHASFNPDQTLRAIATDYENHLILDDVVGCLGEPTDFTAYEDPNADHPSVDFIFYYPELGLVFSSYNHEPGTIDYEAIPIHLQHITGPQPDSVALLERAMIFFSPDDLQDWKSAMRPWQGWEAVTFSDDR